jgi:arsenate reductase-like glutaredoxin family protein
MGEIATSDRQITIFYNSDSDSAKQTLAYAKAEGLPIQKIDILKNAAYRNSTCRAGRPFKQGS